MSWQSLAVAPAGTHHVDACGKPVYDERFDAVLKFHAPGLAPVLRGAEAWHIRVDGSPAYERRFVRTFGYYDGLAAVVQATGWSHITPDGADAHGGRFAWCGNFQQQRCAVREHDGRYVHINPSGEPGYAARWRYVGDYRDGIAVVQADDGHSSHVDMDGVLVHAQWFVDLDVFHKGFARARDEEGWMHVDLTGRSAYRRRFHAVEPFYNGQARVERFDGGLEVIDESGATLVELRPARRPEFASLSADLVGFWKTRAIAAAVELGVIDRLPATEQDTGEACRLRPDLVPRLLRALGELGITARREEQWTLTARGEFLRSDHPLTLADAALEYAGPFTALWRQLPDALRMGSGWQAPDIFGEVARDEMRRAGHHRMLRSYARHDYREVCGALGLRGNERVVDAGGGLGVLAELIVEAHPFADVMVLERPEVVAMAPALPSVRWQSGDLLAPWNIEADAVILSRILHDWDDAQAIRILEHARAVLPTGGRLYVVEMLMPEDGVAGALCDLHLLMSTGGRERTSADFGRMLSAARFEMESVRRLPALPSVIVGVACD